jgi:hypothetical protein
MRYARYAFLALAIATLTSAQEPPLIRGRVEDILARMKSTQLSARERAFDDLMLLVSEDDHQTRVGGSASTLATFLVRHPDQADSVKLGLIQLLSSSNDLFVVGKNVENEVYTENDSGHYADFIDTVASLDDERAIPALVGAMTTGGIAKRGLLKYGDKALGPVMEQLKNEDPLVRAAALGMSISLLKPKKDSPSRQRVLELVRSALADPASVVRGHAIREIDCLEERQEFLPVLKQMSRDDPEKFPRRTADGSPAQDFYPVRYDAQRVLGDIRNNKACTP